MNCGEDRGIRLAWSLAQAASGFWGQMMPGNKWLPKQQGDCPEMGNWKTKWQNGDHSHSKVRKLRLESGSKCTINQWNKHRHRSECKNEKQATTVRQARLNQHRYQARIGASEPESGEGWSGKKRAQISHCGQSGIQEDWFHPTKPPGSCNLIGWCCVAWCPCSPCPQRHLLIAPHEHADETLHQEH